VAEDLRNYIYVSQNKLDQLLGQMSPGELAKVGSETKIKLPGVEHSVKAEFDKQGNHFTQIRMVTEGLKSRGLLGEFLDYKPWFETSLGVDAMVVGDRVFYIGRTRIPQGFELRYAFQCSLKNHIGIENVSEEVLQSCGIDRKIDLGRNLKLTILGINSTSHLFAAAMGSASLAVDRSEDELNEQRETNPRRFQQFFASEKDLELYHANRPTSGDFVNLERGRDNNDAVLVLRGWFGGYRKGLVNPGRVSLLQSLKNLWEVLDPKPDRHGLFFADCVATLKRMHNFRELSKRIRSDEESEILKAIDRVADREPEQNVSIVGMRLLDGYCKDKLSRGARRVILASPLYISHSYFGLVQRSNSWF
jgi:hypothetical protein